MSVGELLGQDHSLEAKLHKIVVEGNLLADIEDDSSDEESSDGNETENESAPYTEDVSAVCDDDEDLEVFNGNVMAESTVESSDVNHQPLGLIRNKKEDVLVSENFKVLKESSSLEDYSEPAGGTSLIDLMAASVNAVESGSCLMKPPTALSISPKNESFSPSPKISYSSVVTDGESIPLSCKP